MKLVSLNTWGGKIYQPLVDFIRQHSKDTDIFCLQEVYSTETEVKEYKDIRTNLLNELKKILPDFQVFCSIEIRGFDPISRPVNFDLTFSKAIFIKDHFKVNNPEDILLYGNREEKSLKKDFSNLAVTLQSIEFTVHEKKFTIVNIHGTPFPGDKLDTSLRIEHSHKIKRFLNSKPGAKIMVGDFNLLPATKSIKMLEDNMRNLIKEFNIQRTRSKLSPFYGRTDFQKFADYTFVSNEVQVKSFEVPKLEISDHLPMILQFS